MGAIINTVKDTYDGGMNEGVVAMRKLKMNS